MDRDTLPEWSKGVDSSSTSASCVGSNPTGVILALLYASRLFVQFLQVLALFNTEVRDRLGKLEMLPSFCDLVRVLQSEGCVTEGA